MNLRMENTVNDRTKTVYRNSIVALFGQLIQVLIGFVIRKLFIDTLGINYLGYNSVFSNVLQMLSLADMGIGVAIISFLFKPLAEGDNNRISALMYLYKKIYSIIGFAVLSIGVILSIWLDVLVPDANCSLFYLRLMFYINLVGTVSTYFLAYKRTLIIADQKSYVINLVDTGMYIGISIVQVVILLVFPNYIVFLVLQIARNIISNIILSIKCDKEYGRWGNGIDKKLVDEYKPQLLKYVKDVFISKVGSIIFYNTDNVIISIFCGSILTGFLSNYTLITAQLTTIVNQILGSLQATFGNYVHSEKCLAEQRRMTDNYFCVNYIIGNFCMICFSLLVQPFVKMFFGENMLLKFTTVFLLAINLMLSFLIQLPSQVFVIYKLFRYDRPIIIISAMLNIGISVALINVMGINGVLIGTFITSLIYMFSRFYIIAKHVYRVYYWYYLKKIFSYILISLASFSFVFFATKNMNYDGLFCFIIRVLAVGLLSALSTAFFVSFTKEFEFLKNKFLPVKIRKFVKRSTLGVGCIAIAMAVIFWGEDNQATFSTARNKSYDRTDMYAISENQSSNIFHLSFDDTVFIFKDLKENRYDSIFENGTLNWFRELHDRYGVVISCYVYYENSEFNLSQVPNIYHKEFVDNSEWLRFGFHTVNENTDYRTGEIVADYKMTVKELERIVGTEAIDNIVRLQMFQGSSAEIKKLVSLDDEPVKGLLTADDDRQSYYLDSTKSTYIYSHDMYYDSEMKLYFMSTDLRIEYVENIDKKIKELEKDCWNNQIGDLVVFSHEWALNVGNKEKIEKICKYADEKGYRFVFFEDEL